MLLLGHPRMHPTALTDLPCICKFFKKQKASKRKINSCFLTIFSNTYSRVSMLVGETSL